MTMKKWEKIQMRKAYIQQQLRRLVHTGKCETFDYEIIYNEYTGDVSIKTKKNNNITTMAMGEFMQKFEKVLA